MIRMFGTTGFELVLNMDPPTVTHQAKIIARRGARGALIDSPDLKAVRARYLDVLLRSGSQPCRPLVGPIYLSIDFVFLHLDPSKWGRGHDAKPDRDNLEKTIVDAMVEARFIHQDQTICDGPISKHWGKSGHISIRAFEI